MISRVVLGNAIAIKAFQDGTLPFPDGTFIARLAWKYVPSEQNNAVFGRAQSFVTGAPTNLEFMVKDSKKYAASGGWGFGQFTNGKPDEEALHKTCFSCHQPAKGHDLVFTRYAPELSPTPIHQGHGSNHDSRKCGAPNFRYEVRSCDHSSFGYRPQQAVL
jgi:hypothetical protein